jgi:hypothetical protein
VTNLREGDQVEVWGEVTRSTDAYRGHPARMSPGKKSMMYIFQGGRKLNRRLAIAAAVELAISASFLVIGAFFGFYVLDIYLFEI